MHKMVSCTKTRQNRSLHGFYFYVEGGGYIIIYSLNWSGWHIFQKPFRDLPFQPSWHYRTAKFCQVFGGQLLPLVHWTLRVVFFVSRWNPRHAQIWCSTCWWLAPQTLSWVGSSHMYFCILTLLRVYPKHESLTSFKDSMVSTKMWRLSSMALLIFEVLFKSLVTSLPSNCLKVAHSKKETILLRSMLSPDEMMVQWMIETVWILF